MAFVTAEGSKQVEDAIEAVDREVEEAKKALLALLQDAKGGLRASEAFDHGVTKLGVYPAVLREALWQLLEEKVILLTDDRRIRATAPS